ncbi:hypothetical protein LSTR_LSTR005016 [Laodelphax striatellus]|uniref:AN1-type domain-containing protein n=1 Tax=Laodelphax striatellus TaxID=195883 RepID=A0A482XKB5_LAOST|nr:hypothetical protein LSTR_LSTR005016 [Laodelphax striatellus]
MSDSKKGYIPYESSEDEEVANGMGCVAGGSAIGAAAERRAGRTLDDSHRRQGGQRRQKQRKRIDAHSAARTVGLTGFECRCGGLYCAVHRYSDKHDCSFDYRELGAQEIRRNNPVVVGEKIQKI